MRRGAAPVLVLLLALAAAAPSFAQPEPQPAAGDPQAPPLPMSCRPGPSLLTGGSIALGSPSRGRLARGLRFPAETDYAFTWDFPLGQSPSRWWRRYGTERLVLTVECVLFLAAVRHPLGQRIGVADLSRPGGGPFGARYGGLGHASHQNGLDVDVLYPRRDGCECAAQRPADIDTERSQELIDAFVAAGAQYVFVSPALRRRGLLRGPAGIVQPLVYHDDHFHVRLRP